ncbi:unnamed protein product [Caenorhabditis bovis]|uniref:DUOXA-like protein C06E1.3 n=1 Tax=Caenorhabditis bovis TaxID=2654633 RepID=A0A8S1EZE1_9PELO|nr:unnamed protein product [Caenorhabditis bovis]
MLGGNPRPSNYENGELPNFNMTTFVIFMIFVVPLIAYLIILPGVRKKVIITSAVYIYMMFVGGVLACVLYFPCWAYGSQMIYTQFRAHSNERILAQIGVEIGLQKVNVTLKFERLLYSDDIMPGIDMTKLYYNEGFDITGVSSMSEALHNAQKRGLPYPMLSVLEYFSLNQDAFDWGRHYRVAGHYSHAAICFALACWVLSMVFLLVLPHYVYQSLLATGVSCFVACLLYFIMSPCELRIAFTGENLERVDLTATFSVCFYLTLANTIICVVGGALLGVLKHWRIYTLSTFFDAAHDEHVGPKTRGVRDDLMQGCRVISQRHHIVAPHTNICHSADGSTDKTNSSGFESKPTSCHISQSSASLTSQASFETVRDEEELENRTNRFTEQSTSST